MKTSSAGAMQRARKWFDGLEPKAKGKAVMFGVTGLLLTIFVVVSVATPDTRQKQTSQSGGSKRPGRNLLQAPTEGMGIDAVSSEVSELRKELTELRRLQAQGGGRSPAEEPARGTAEPVAPPPAASPDEALANVRDQITGSPMYSAPVGTTLNPVRPTADNQPRLAPQPAPRPTTSSQQVPPPTAPKMQVVRGSATASVPVARQAPPSPVYLPTGSIMTGVLLNGLDAPTGRGTQSQPVPVVVRLQHDAILPSRYRSDVREAFVLASGFGDLSSERAYLRAERLSMILRNGQIIDIPIKMSAIGSDGKTGLRGTVVSKQGALIAKAMLAGTADGVSRAFGGNSVGGFGRRNELPESRDLMIGGIGGGASSALDRVASYFLEQAEAMYPVVEIAAGREVSFLLLEGTELQPRVIESAADQQQAP